MSDFLENWAGQSDENRRLLAQEVLITETTEAIWQAMEELGVNKTELANRLGTTKGYVSQILGGSRNMTLRTLADICQALSVTPSLAMRRRDHHDGWRVARSSPLGQRRRRYRYGHAGRAVVHRKLVVRTV